MAKKTKIKSKNSFVIDRSKWRCGGDHPNDGQRGEGETELLNDEDISLAGSQYVVLETAGVKSMDWSWSGEAPAAHTLVAFNPLEETVDTTSGMHALMQ